MALVAQVGHVRPVLVALVAQADLVRPVPVVLHVQVSVALVRVLASVALVRLAVRALVSVLLVRAAALLLVAVVAVAAPPVHSVRVALVAPRRPASQSVQSAKNSSRDQHRALVVRLFHAAMAPLFCVCVAAQAFRTSQTRLTPTLVS